MIKAFFDGKLPNNGHISIDHIRKGPASDRVLTKVVLVEFPSKHIRDSVLKRIKDGTLTLFDGNNDIKMKPAKTKRQMQRAWAMNKAIEIVTADARARGKNVKSEWMVNNNRGHRQILVDGIQAFEQCPSDNTGLFKGDFTHLQLP